MAHVYISTAHTRFVDELAVELKQPQLSTLIRRFLYDQLHPDADVPGSDVDIQFCPTYTGRVGVFRSANITFYAPTEEAGLGGMHRETFRCNPSWRGQYERYDTVLIQQDASKEGMRGMVIGRVMALLRLKHYGEQYPCALVHWFVLEGDEPDEPTGMWVAYPEMDGESPSMGLVHLDCIVRAAHLIAVYNDRFLPWDFHFSFSLDYFDRFYVNKYIDYHAHNCME